MQKKILLCTALIWLTACNSPTAPEKYLYQNKKVDFPYTDFENDRATAEQTARKEVDAYAKADCREISYGWALDKIDNPGQLSCEESPEGHHCRLKQVAFVCRQRDER
ncbi:MAG: hypothetical protein ACRER2_05430 [Methylococcales bacterium]